MQRGKNRAYSSCGTGTH